MDSTVIEKGTFIAGAGNKAVEILTWLLRHATKPGD
jgi:hypothetical protein